MAKPEQKTRAFELRREGKSIKEIAAEVGVSRGTASTWMKEVSLTAEQELFIKEQMYARGHKGRMIGAEMNKNKKIERQKIANDEAVEMIEQLSLNELFYLGLGIYWGEGTKAQSTSLAVTNSDPRIIKIMIRWFVECLGVQVTDLHPRVYISDNHQDREEKLYEYWIHELGIPRSQFKKMIFLNKGKKIYENREMYYGVLTLLVAKGTDLRYKILAFLARIAEVEPRRGV